MTWFEIWRKYQLDGIRVAQEEICTCHDTKKLKKLGELLAARCECYDNEMREFRFMTPAEVERVCHEDMVWHWQLLRIEFEPEFAKLAA